MTRRIRSAAQRVSITTDNRRWWTLGAMCFALFMLMLDTTVVNVALPSIQRDLHASLSGLEWTINAYTLTFAVLLVTGGRLGDIYGRRLCFLIGVVVFALSSATIGISSSEAALIVGRAAQGVGAALMMPGTLSIITNTFPPQERGRAIGTWAGVSALALAIGPVIGGYLTEYVSWRAIFFLNLPVATAAVAVTLFATHESRDETVEPRVDLIGIGTLTAGLGALVLALVEGNAWHWGSTRILALFALAVAGLVGFAVAELRGRVPMVEFRFFRSRSFLGANVVAFIVSYAMFAMFFFLALYMQNVLRFSPLQAGVRFLPSTLVLMVTAPVAGRLADRIGPRPLISGGLLAIAGALLWLSRIGVHTSFGYLLPAFMLMGLGMGFVMSPMSTAAMNAVDRSKAGVASGILSMNRMVGGTFGVAALGALVAGLGASKLATLLPALPAARRSELANALGAGATTTGHGSLAAAMQQAYVYALGHGLQLSAAAAAIGSLLAWRLIDSRPAREPASEARPSTPPASPAPRTAAHGREPEPALAAARRREPEPALAEARRR